MYNMISIACSIDDDDDDDRDDHTSSRVRGEYVVLFSEWWTTSRVERYLDYELEVSLSVVTLVSRREASSGRNRQ